MPPEQFYAGDLTDKSLDVVTSLLHRIPTLVLMGGWATWRRTGALRSHDVDVLASQEDKERLLELFDEMSSSTHVGQPKWRGELDGIHVDVYVPYQSVIGERLQLKAEALLARSEIVEGWRILELPAHLASKLAAVLDRPDSLPGTKDRDEIVSLLGAGVGAAEVAEVLKDASLRSRREVCALLVEGMGFVREAVRERSAAAFLENWVHEAGQVLTGDGLEPPREHRGPDDRRSPRDKGARRSRQR